MDELIEAGAALLYSETARLFALNHNGVDLQINEYEFAKPVFLLVINGIQLSESSFRLRLLMAR